MKMIRLNASLVKYLQRFSCTHRATQPGLGSAIKPVNFQWESLRCVFWRVCRRCLGRGVQGDNAYAVSETIELTTVVPSSCRVEAAFPAELIGSFQSGKVKVKGPFP